MVTYLMEFDVLRRKAGTRMVTGSGFPDEFVSVLRMQNAALPKNGKTLVWASVRHSLAALGAFAQMRRLSGSCGRATRQDVLVFANMDTASEQDDFKAWTA